MHYNSIFFDLDGTLCDSYPGIENGIKMALNSQGVHDIGKNDITKLIGIPLHESLDRHYFNDTHKTQQAVKVFRTYYDEQGIMESEIYTGIPELLQRLSLCSELFVITAKPTHAAKRILKHHHLSCYFKEILGCSSDGANFCKSELIRKVTARGHSIIIGDKSQDIEAGKKAFIKTCGVLYGYGTEQEIKDSNPDFISRSVPGLDHIV
jgi:phosphoglycolate phosphatase